MSKILVTGINGFVGKHLARELAGRTHKVIGVGLNGGLDQDLEGLVDKYYDCDLTNSQKVSEIPLDGVEGVVSLAGLAQVGQSFKNPELTKKINVDVLAVLGQRLVDERIPARLIAVSTGAVYDAKQPLPLTEDSKLVDSGSPYAQSKLLMEEEALRLKKAGLDCIVVRPFNHIGPGQEAGFLVPDLFEKISKAPQNNNEIAVGNLETKRDYTDVRDVVKAYCDLLESEVHSDIYNVCSGRRISGSELLEKLLSLTGSKDIKITVDQNLIRPDDPSDLYGSNQKIHGDTGWTPSIPLETTLKDFVDSFKA